MRLLAISVAVVLILTAGAAGSEGASSVAAPSCPLLERPAKLSLLPPRGRHLGCELILHEGAVPELRDLMGERPRQGPLLPLRLAIQML